MMIEENTNGNATTIINSTKDYDFYNTKVKSGQQAHDTMKLSDIILS